MIMIENKGEIELPALDLLGASVKGNDNPIGFFGSGNKYAVAWLLREGIPFRIFSGEKEIIFSTEEVNFRGEIFSRILIDGRPTSFTTRMGPDWDAWSILREFISNSLDEGGFRLEYDEPPAGAPDTTRIFIEQDAQIQDVLDDIGSYFAFGESAVLEINSEGKILSPGKKNSFIVYRRGIQVYYEETPALFRYELPNISINESRLVNRTWELHEAIGRILASSFDPEIVGKVINDIRGTYEGKNARWYGTEFSSVWKETLSHKTIYSDSIYERIGALEDTSQGLILPDDLFAALKSYFGESLPFYGGIGEVSYKPREFPPEHQRQLDIALRHLKKLGITPPAPIVSIIPLLDGLVALYDPVNKRIGLGDECFGDSRQLQLILMEEIDHAHGHTDGTRRYEQYLRQQLLSALNAYQEVVE